MSAIYNQVLFHWIDVNGGTAVSFITTQDQTEGGASDYASLASAAQACCDAKIIAVQYQSTMLIGGDPEEGPYQTVWDRGVLLGRNSVTGQAQKSVLVGPKEDIFLTGNRVIDLSNTQILALQSEVMAVVGNAVGDPAGPFRRGNRQSASGG